MSNCRADRVLRAYYQDADKPLWWNEGRGAWLRSELANHPLGCSCLLPGGDLTANDTGS